MTQLPLTHSNAPALLLVGHGTRSPLGQAEFRQLLQHVVHLLPDIRVEGCFLEMLEPTLPHALHSLEQRDLRHVIVVPLLLFEAGHAKQDIPQWTRRSGLKVRVTPALKWHPSLLTLSAQRWTETIQSQQIPSDECLWLLVGRGSRDADATVQFQEFLMRRRRLTPVGEARGGFLAMASPRVESVMQEARESPLKWVVVQPHLLFTGDLMHRLNDLVRAHAERSGRQQWVMTRHLGSDVQVARAVVDRYRQAATSLAHEVWQP